MTKIYGHRGSKGKYPENTLLSIRKALEAGVEGIEIDVHLTKDDEFVVIHDETLDRTTTGSGYIKDYTLAEIRKFSAGSKFTDFENYDDSWDLELVPTLREVVHLLSQYDVELNVELKTYEIVYHDIEKKVLLEMEKCDFKGKVVYSSFLLPTVRRLQEICPTCEVAWLLNHGMFMPEDYITNLNLETLHVGKDIVLNNSDVWKSVSEKLRIWTVNDEAEIQFLLDLGVAAIITDFPERALKLRK